MFHIESCAKQLKKTFSYPVKSHHIHAKSVRKCSSVFFDDMPTNSRCIKRAKQASKKKRKRTG